MADEVAMQAIARIERALARIEASAARLQEAPKLGDNGELRALQQVHQSLRDKVEDAIGQIDRLIEMRGEG